MVSSNVIWVHTKEDMSEMWSEVKRQGMLWCNGLGGKAGKSGCKGRCLSDEDSDDKPSVAQPKKKKQCHDNEDKVQEIVEDLKLKHGTQYTVMQLCIWAELIASSLYCSTSDPPSDNSIFKGLEETHQAKERSNWNTDTNGERTYAALVQFDCYQHRCEWKGLWYSSTVQLLSIWT